MREKKRKRTQFTADDDCVFLGDTKTHLRSNSCSPSDTIFSGNGNQRDTEVYECVDSFMNSTLSSQVKGRRGRPFFT